MFRPYLFIDRHLQATKAVRITLHAVGVINVHWKATTYFQSPLWELKMIKVSDTCLLLEIISLSRKASTPVLYEEDPPASQQYLRYNSPGVCRYFGSNFFTPTTTAVSRQISFLDPKNTGSLSSQTVKSRTFMTTGLSCSFAYSLVCKI